MWAFWPQSPFRDEPHVGNNQEQPDQSEQKENDFTPKLLTESRLTVFVMSHIAKYLCEKDSWQVLTNTLLPERHNLLPELTYKTNILGKSLPAVN